MFDLDYQILALKNQKVADRKKNIFQKIKIKIQFTGYLNLLQQVAWFVMMMIREQYHQLRQQSYIEHHQGAN